MGDVGFDRVNSRHSHKVSLPWAQRLRRWFNINAKLVYRVIVLPPRSVIGPIERVVRPLLSDTVSKAVAQH